MKRICLLAATLLLLVACGAQPEEVELDPAPAVEESSMELVHEEVEAGFPPEEELQEPELPPLPTGENNVIFMYLQETYALEEINTPDFVFESLVRNESPHRVWVPALYAIERLVEEEWEPIPYSTTWTQWPRGYMLTLENGDEEERFYHFDIFELEEEAFSVGTYRIVQVVEAFDERDEFMFASKAYIQFHVQP